MNEPPYIPTHPPKPCTPEEKIIAFDKVHGITYCPDPFSKEMTAYNKKRTRKWRKKLTKWMKKKLSWNPAKNPDQTPKAKKQRQKAYLKQWHAKKKKK